MGGSVTARLIATSPATAPVTSTDIAGVAS